MRVFLPALVTMVVVLAGCTAPAAEEAAPAGAMPPAPALASSPLEAAGLTTTYACAALVLPDCPTLVPGEDMVILEAPGPVAGVRATIAWADDPPAPVTIWAWLHVDRGDGFAHEDGVDPEAVGAPPLEIAWNLTRYGDARLAIVVYSMEWNGIVAAGVAPPMRFRMTGEILSEAASGDA